MASLRRIRRLGDSKGTNMVEAAIITPLLLLLTFSIVDYGAFFHAYLALENGVSQATRYYFWRTASFPIPRGEIEASSANMHMIPAGAAVERRLKAVRTGQVVSLSGYLVEVRARDGWGWRSSLTRTDTGNAACELVWVERIEIR